MRNHYNLRPKKAKIKDDKLRMEQTREQHAKLKARPCNVGMSCVCVCLVGVMSEMAEFSLVKAARVYLVTWFC